MIPKYPRPIPRVLQTRASRYGDAIILALCVLFMLFAVGLTAYDSGYDAGVQQCAKAAP